MGDLRTEWQPITSSRFEPEYKTVWPNEYQSFNMESARLATYREWSTNFLKPEDLARSGFVYLKRGDRVQCCFCYGILTDWEQGDVPMQEHSKHFPNCPFVKDPRATRNLSPEAAFIREFDVCGTRPMNMNSFTPERTRTSPPQEVFKDLNIIRHYPPKHPSYSTQAARLKSYTNWPKAMPQDVNELVAAGFFYTGLSDQVKCFQCGGSLKAWKADDVPIKEHALWYPECPFVNLIKGKDFVETVKKQKLPVSNEIPAKVGAPSNPSELSDPSTSCTQGLEDTSMNAATINANCNGASCSPMDTTSDESNYRLCKICLNHEMSTLFLPCRHLAACVQCAAELSSCPVCRSEIKGKIHTYLT